MNDEQHDLLKLIQDTIKETNSTQTVTKLHASCTAWVCDAVNTSTFEQWLKSENLDPQHGENWLKIYQSIAQQLESDEFLFDVVMNGDDTNLPDQAATLAEWCDAFIFTIGTCNNILTTNSDDTHELLADLIEISKLDPEINTSENGETMLTELHEFVRIAVMTIYLEARKKQK